MSGELSAKAQRIEIETEVGLDLKEFVVEDAPAYFYLLNRNRAYLNQQHTGGRYHSGDEFMTYEELLENLLNPIHPEIQKFRLWDNGEMVGALNLIPDENRRVAIGFWVGEEFKGRGYATGAVEAACRHAFEQQDVDLICAEVLVGNQPSKRVLEKAGFSLAGTFTREIDGDTEQLWEYHLLR